MAGEVTIPILPCGGIDEVGEFYQVLGFAVTYRQTRPNPYLVVRREDIELHFVGVAEFDPEGSHGSCIVQVPDIAALYDSFAEAMRGQWGKVLASGIPRMTRPRKRKNTGQIQGFNVIDPGGNWIRIFQRPDGTQDTQDTHDEEPVSRLARALQNAVVLGDSKGDTRQAARILDSALRKPDSNTPPADLAEALVYRAELALAMNDTPRAKEVLAQVADIQTDENDPQLDQALAAADQLRDNLQN